MMKIYYDEDVTTNILSGKTVAVIGYGIQGVAQAKNLRDSKIDVVIGCWEKDDSKRLATEEGFRAYSYGEAATRADIILMLVPDMIQPTVYKTSIEPALSEGKALGFAHGFNIHYKQIIPPPNIDVFMVAPKGPGKLVREMYQMGRGVPALIAVHQDYTGKAETIALEVAKAIGCTRVGVIKTTFKDETESDLIGEQIVLVGGLMELLKKGFEVLVEEGYPMELAYFEACNEAKLIMDLIYERGVAGMLRGVSETARYGGLTVGPKVIDDHVKEAMRKAARAVKSGAFSSEWITEYRNGSPNMKRLLKEIDEHQMEKVGAYIREMAKIGK
ncbi:MAG: ketol-acid reductoisomerase [Candidatus Bathyarchaeia archaeon]